MGQGATQGGGASAGGLTRDAVAVYGSKWMRGREEVVLSKEMERGVVTVVVDAQVEDELVVW